MRFQKARPANCNASGWQRSWVLGSRRRTARLARNLVSPPPRPVQHGPAAQRDRIRDAGGHAGRTAGRDPRRPRPQAGAGSTATPTAPSASSLTLGVTMALPGETEAGSAGKQPCRGIARRAHRDDDHGRGSHGSSLTGLVSQPVLMLAFAALMLAVGSTMLRRRPELLQGERCYPVRCLTIGAGVGVLTGFLGVGGGFLIVPVLVILAGIEMKKNEESCCGITRHHRTQCCFWTHRAASLCAVRLDPHRSFPGTSARWYGGWSRSCKPPFRTECTPHIWVVRYRRRSGHWRR